MTTLTDIEARAKTYAAAREKLTNFVAELNTAIAALKKDHLPAIKRALARAAEEQAELQALIAGAPELFTKPRTKILHGVKVGYVKAKGTLQVADEARTVALIRRHFPDQAETLIRTTETPHKPGLLQLNVADLKRLGCTVTETGDEIVIKAVDSEVDKMVEALLKDAVDTETGASA